MLVILKIIIIISIFKISDGLLNSFQNGDNDKINTQLKYIFDNFYEEKYTDGTIAFVLENSLNINDNFENVIKYAHDNRKAKIVLFNIKENCNVQLFKVIHYFIFLTTPLVYSGTI